LKPAFEPIIVAMKPIDGTFAENALKWGVAGLNIDGGRVPTDDTVTINTWDNGAQPFGDGAGKPFTSREETQGRWPANILHDGSEEVLSGFPNSKGWTHSTKGDQIDMTNVPIGGGQINCTYGDDGSAARFFYCAKVSRAERNMGLDGMTDVRGGSMEANIKDTMQLGGASLKGEPKEIQPTKNNHPTVKPLSLMEYLCRLTKTPTGGIVLDPFMGSGTTGMACKKLGRDFIGIELDEHYFEIAEKRIASVNQVELL